MLWPHIPRRLRRGPHRSSLFPTLFMSDKVSGVLPCTNTSLHASCFFRSLWWWQPLWWWDIRNDVWSQYEWRWWLSRLWLVGRAIRWAILLISNKFSLSPAFASFISRTSKLTIVLISVQKLWLTTYLIVGRFVPFLWFRYDKISMINISVFWIFIYYSWVQDLYFSGLIDKFWRKKKKKIVFYYLAQS